jgi:excisionase family DNA binding protein
MSKISADEVAADAAKPDKVKPDKPSADEVATIAQKPALFADEVAAVAAKPILTVREAALLSGTSVGSLYRWWAAGRGPASFKVGKCRRIKRVDLDAWIAGLRGDK